MATPSNLGAKVTTREVNWADLCHEAWGSEFYAPDHGAYEFSNGRKWDSSDKGKSGIYGVVVYEGLGVDDNYPDMRSVITMSSTFYEEIALDYGPDNRVVFVNASGIDATWVNQYAQEVDFSKS